MLSMKYWPHNKAQETFTLIGAELDSHSTIMNTTTYDLPEVKIQSAKSKTADFMTIADRRSL